MPLLRNPKATTVTALLALTLLGSLGYFKVYAGGEDGKPAAETPTAHLVDVAEVMPREITEWLNYSGRLEAVEKVDLQPLVSGTLIAVHFKEGDLVKKGDLLFTIDPRPYAAEVARAKAQVAAAEARVAYTSSELNRAKRLITEHAIARREFEERQNAALEAEAAKQMAIATLKTAQLNLEYTRITAPVSGRISRTIFTPGNIVTAGANTPALTTLVSVSKVYASFDVDEQSYLKHVNPGRSSNGDGTPVFLGLANEEGHPRPGKINLIDNRMDAASGTIRIRAEFDNTDGILLPGLYARIRLGGNDARQALLINEKAVGIDQDKRFVLVVDAENKTNYREIRLGTHYEGMRIVENGLQAGERIVVNGLQRIRPGDMVSPQPVAMTPHRKPDPATSDTASTGERPQANKTNS